MNENTITRPITPHKGETVILRYLRGCYPGPMRKAIRRGAWHAHWQHARYVTETTFSVATGSDVRETDGSLTRVPRVDVDVLAGTCTCEDGAPCEHYFAAVISLQLDALDRVYRTVYPNTCRKRWCAVRKNPWRLLCESHQRELLRMLDREELRTLRTARLVVEVAKKLRGDDAA